MNPLGLCLVVVVILMGLIIPYMPGDTVLDSSVRPPKDRLAGKLSSVPPDEDGQFID